MPADSAADRLARVFLVLSAVAAIVAFGVWLTGGGVIEIAGATLRVRRVERFAIVAGVAAAAFLLTGRARRTAAFAWLWEVLDRRASLIAAAIAIAAGVIAWTYSTNTAGGSDSFCYLRQAELLASGRLQDPQPLATAADWPDPVGTFVSPGHVRAPGGAAAIVPMCPAGYPLILAAASLAGGRPAMFAVVPVLGVVMVWLTFLLARGVGGPRAGVLAALWLAASAAFLHQSFQPMSDLPAAAAWTGALVGATRARPFAAGLLAGLALMIRPNLAPLGLVVAGIVASNEWPRRGAIVTALVRCAAGALPALAAVLVLQRLAYGGALSSGYGDLGQLFALGQVWPNLTRYSTWLVETQTAAVALAIVAPLLAPPAARRIAWWLLAFALVTLGMYLPYLVFESWWYLRFLLPAYPALMTLLAIVAMRVVASLPGSARGPATVAAGGGLAVVLLHLAIGHGIFGARDFEQRFRDTGAYLSAELPEEAVVLAHDLGGASRFYSGRPTLQWKALDPAWLDRAIASLQGRGLKPYLALEAAEEEMFRARFAAGNALGRLDWPPRADIERKVFVYDFADRARTQRGEAVDTKIIRTR